MNETFALGIQLMLYGLAGVFTTLLLFMLSIWLLTKIFPYREEKLPSDERYRHQ